MKNKEMKLYEKLGVREFRWLAFSLRKVFLYPFTIGMSEKERRNFMNRPDNYNMGYTRNIKEIGEYKNNLFLNAGIHVFSLLYCIKGFIDYPYLITVPILALPIVINIYCLMLQRYNYIRIKQFTERIKSRNEKVNQPEETEPQKELSMSKNISNKRLDTIKELKQHRNYLESLRRANQAQTVTKESQIKLCYRPKNF